METKKPVRKKRKNQYTGIFIVFWALAALIVVFVISGQASRYNELRDELVRIQNDVAAAIEVQESLQFQEEFYDSDLHIEQLARDRLGMVRPNEIVFRNSAFNE